MRVLPISFGFSAVVIVSGVMNGYLLVRSDAWLHASIISEILDRGLPPMEPNFPDIPIRYMWFYHLFLATWKIVSGLSIFQAMWCFSAVSAFVFPYLVARLTWFFTRTKRHMLAACLLAIAGLGSAAWVFWPVVFVRILFGNVRGTEELTRTLASIDLNGARVIHFLKPFGMSLVNLLDKFLTVTAFSYTMNLFLFYFILMLDTGFHRRSPKRAAMKLFTILTGATLFHLLTGITLVVVTLGAGMLIALTQFRRAGPKVSAFQYAVIPVVSILSAAVALPYISSLTHGATGRRMFGDYVHIGLPNLLIICATLVALGPFTISALRRLLRSASPQITVVLTWTVLLTVLSVFVDLPTVAERKLVHFVFLLFTPFMAWELVDRIVSSTGARRALTCLWIGVLFVVPTVLTVRGFILDKPDTRLGESRYRVSDDERALYDWIQSSTAPNAVIIENNNYNNMPVHAHRRSFCLNPRHDIFGYGGAKVEQYRALRDELYSGNPITIATIELLRSTGAEFLVVIWEEDVNSRLNLETKFRSHPEWFYKTFENPAAKVYAVLDE